MEFGMAINKSKDYSVALLSHRSFNISSILHSKTIKSNNDIKEFK